ncbi:MAG: FISUMP domain-containing protein [Prolixibacteraceae bacterium]|jgi:uncharacterized protein (TIGR02145 family)|nr:FISUMP domain-containing protein [Prolixibacteraceae bacterium]
MKQKTKLIAITTMFAIIIGACDFLFLDPQVSIKNVEWRLSHYRYLNSIDENLENGTAEILNILEQTLTFKEDGTFSGKYIALLIEGISDSDTTGFWTLDEFNDRLNIWTDETHQANFHVLSLTDSLLELQVSDDAKYLYDDFLELYSEALLEEPLVFVYSKQGTTIPVSNNNSFIDERDGHEYSIVSIGTQTWMAENLAYLPEVYSPIQSSASSTEPRFYVYDYLGGGSVAAAKATETFKTYGVLYNHVSATKVCPSGWRLPTVSDWTQLENQFGGNNNAGNALKEIGTAHWTKEGEWSGGTNESGFTALPGGFMNASRSGFYDINDVGLWWLADYGTNESEAWRRDLSHNQIDVGDHIYSTDNGYSVRCIKGESDTEENIFGQMKDPRDGFEYNTVKIGDQTWMAENMALLPNQIKEPGYNSYDEPVTYVYDFYGGYRNDAMENPYWQTYGALYNWPMAQFVCPKGWTLPSKEDWEILANEAGGKESAGIALKEAGTEYWKSPNNAAKNTSGFTALPGGLVNNGFFAIGEFGHWWSSSPDGITSAFRRDLSYNSTDLGFHSYTKSHGYSVRCIKEKIAEETFIDSRDGSEYKTVKIGNQVWMAENLAYIPFDPPYNHNINYPSDQLGDKELELNTPRYYVYDFYYPYRTGLWLLENFKTYGVLYNWYAAEDACPAGWHLPSNDEWITLANNAGGKTSAGRNLKISNQNYWWEYNTPVDNSTGFSALPGGFVDRVDNEYEAMGKWGFWWTSTESGNVTAYGKTFAIERDLSYDHADLGEHSRQKDQGCSIRCIRD